MERLLSAAGINGFDPNSEVGQLIEDCRTLLNKAARADIPDVVVEQGIEEYIEAVTIRRALYKKLVELEAPREDDSDEARAHNAAYAAAYRAYSGMSHNTNGALKKLGITTYLKVTPKPSDDGDIKTQLARMADRRPARAPIAAEFTEVEHAEKTEGTEAEGAASTSPQGVQPPTIPPLPVGPDEPVDGA